VSPYSNSFFRPPQRISWHLVSATCAVEEYKLPTNLPQLNSTQNIQSLQIQAQTLFHHLTNQTNLIIKMAGIASTKSYKGAMPGMQCTVQKGAQPGMQCTVQKGAQPGMQCTVQRY
jgi:hypothetical protein